MANHPKKAKDPTEVALSAIQEALNISDGSMPEGERGLVHNDRGSAHNDLTTGPISTSPYDEGTFDLRGGADRQAFEPAEEPRPTRRAANDDRETIGQILQAIQKGRPARNVYTLATIFAGVWTLGAGLLTISFLSSIQAAIGQGSGTLVLAGLAALLIAPVLLFFFLPGLAGLVQEFRLSAQSMPQVPIDFRAPEGAASDS